MIKRTSRLAAVVAVTLATLTAGAQTPKQPVMPSDAALKKVPRPTMPSAEVLQRATKPVDVGRIMEQAGQRAFNNPSGGRGFAMPEVPMLPGGQGVDIEKLASLHKQLPEGPPDDEAPQLVVFVSLSMPQASLKRIGQQARQAGAVVAVRGVLHGLGKGNWDKSLKALTPLAETGADIQIHPQLFARYNITAVPTVVVAASPNPGCQDDACDTRSVSVRGDASLDYILDRIAQRKDDLGAIARERLQKLRKS
jgi:conjugal transfer pilus assembly protein TrbC